MQSVASFLLRQRLCILLLIAAGTAYFALQVRHLTLETRFGDLIPQQHPYIKVHNQVRDIFGGATQVILMLEVRDGDIFNPVTLKKLQRVTFDLERIPGVDPHKIHSIATSRMKDFTFRSGSMDIDTLMFPDIPQTAAQMDRLRDRIYSNARYYGTFVSFDSKKALITVDFFEDGLDYVAVFDALSRIRAQVEDANHILSIAGEPMHLGYIRHYARAVQLVLLATICAILVMLYFYHRSKRATFIPFVGAALSAIWGLGFMALVGFNLDPLVLVLPFLISLMAARHCMQCLSRYNEQVTAGHDSRQAAARVLQTMLLPGMTSIVTDALGIALVAIAAIPVLTHIAIACAFWCCSTIVLSVVFAPLLLSYLPVRRRGQPSARIAAPLERLGGWVAGRGKWYVVVLTALLVVVGLNFAARLHVGDFMPGSSILWPFHRYNRDALRITMNVPLLNPLYVIVAGDEGGFATRGPTLREMERFQRYLSQHDRILFTRSIVNSLPGFLMASYENDPQWCHLPRDDRVLSMITRRLLYSGEPGTWDRFVDMGERYANIIVYCRDKMPSTVASVMAHISAYQEHTPGPPQGSYLLAGGPVGVQAAVRDVLAGAQSWNLLLALTGIFIFCTVMFRSVSAGVMLTVPLAISNVLTFALMGAYHIGLTVNTYPVASVGIGLGVDYGIYFLSRLREEQRHCQDLPQALRRTMGTNGRAIVQIATTLTAGLLLWVVSPLKFQAEMGALLAVLLLLNMLGALLLVPALACLLTPRFLRP